MAIVNNFGAGQTGGNYQPNTYEELGSAIGKVAVQYLREVEAKNPMTVFDKMPIDNGDTIEQAVVKLVEATEYDPTGAGALSRDTREKMAVRYFKNFQRHTYKTTVDFSKIRKVLETGKGASEIADRLVSVLGQSAMNDKYQSLKALLAWGRTPASYDGTNSVLVNVGTVSGGSDYKGILKKIKNVVSGMKYVNADYNRGGIQRLTKEEDIFIVMPYELKNAIDVDELSGVFNLDKAEIRNRIIEIDTDEKFVYIVDRQAVLDYTRLYEMADQKNADGLFWNYFFHVEHLFALSPLFDGCYFEYTAGGEQAYYTVDFDSNGGSAVQSQIVLPSGKITRPSNPTKSGYSFEAWYYNGVQWNFNTGVVNSDMTLVASWL